MDYGGLEKKLKSLSKRTNEFLQALIDEQRRKEEVCGCYRRSAKRKGRKEKKKEEKKKEGTFWSLEEVIGKKIRKKEKEKKRSKGTCGGEKKEGKKGKHKEIWYMCGGEKTMGKKGKKRRRKCYHNLFTINFNIGEKKIIFFKEKKIILIVRSN